MTGTYFDLLRHGETMGGNRYRGSRDDALTAEGWKQMRQALGEDRPWTRVVSSPLIRCRAFAEDFAKRHSLAIEIESRLREIHFGDWEGKTAEELLVTDREHITRFWEDPERYPPPGGEEFATFRKRVLETWQQMTAHVAHEHFLIVTHGGPIRVILGQVLGLDWSAAMQLPVPHAHFLRLRPGSGEWHGCSERILSDGEAH
ncbi:MAG: histidine phosphatase family protein [Acidiferrobacterales bacterium]